MSNVVELLTDLSLYWIESSDIATREQSGTFIIENQAVAGYSKPLVGAVLAECFMWDDLYEKEIMSEQCGRRAPFADVESAKQALQMIARPGLKKTITL